MTTAAAVAATTATNTATISATRASASSSKIKTTIAAMSLQNYQPTLLFFSYYFWLLLPLFNYS